MRKSELITVKWNCHRAGITALEGNTKDKFEGASTSEALAALKEAADGRRGGGAYGNTWLRRDALTTNTKR